MRKSALVMMVLLLATFFACKRMPLYDLEKIVELELELDLKLDIQIDLDVKVDIEVDTVIEIPEHMKVGFYSDADNTLSYTEFVGPTGGIINTPPGTYVMLVYSFGTEYIQIRGEGNINTVEAFTSDITATKGATLRGFTRAGEDNDEPQGPVIYAPDHLLVTRQTVVIPEAATESQTITVHSTVSDIVETYAFQVPDIEGAEYLESVEAFVTNQARSTFFGRGEVSQEPATIWFPVGIDREKGILFTVFNTFGKLPGESHCYLHLLLRDTNGDELRITTDITNEFNKTDHNIIVNEHINVPKPESRTGGIEPSVDPWKEDSTNVNIG